MGISEAAHVLNVSVRTVHRLTKARKLPYVKMDGLLQFRIEDVDRFIDKRLVRAA
jgi:excisionase family DNA binding protein